MPGKQVKNWRQYHALKRKGYSKTKAAKITNASAAKRRVKSRRRRKRR